MNIPNRALSNHEREKLHQNELEVIDFYEKITGNTFMRFELVLVKRVIKSATPAQVNAIIYKMYKTYPQNFVDFFYIVRPVEQMFKNRRGGKKSD